MEPRQTKQKRRFHQNFKHYHKQKVTTKIPRRKTPRPVKSSSNHSQTNKQTNKHTSKKHDPEAHPFDENFPLVLSRTVKKTAQGTRPRLVFTPRAEVVNETRGLRARYVDLGSLTTRRPRVGFSLISILRSTRVDGVCENPIDLFVVCILGWQIVGGKRMKSRGHNVQSVIQ